MSLIVSDWLLSVPLTPARNLRISDVNHSAAKLSWDAASRKVKGYRIVYVKTDAVQTDQVSVWPISANGCFDMSLTFDPLLTSGRSGSGNHGDAAQPELCDGVHRRHLCPL